MAKYELNLRDYYRIARRHIIVIVATAAGLGGLTFTLSPTESTYSARATVRITQASDLTGLLLQTFYWSPEDNISTQTKLISSQPVLLKIAKELNSIPQNVELEEAITHPTYKDIITSLSGKIRAQQVEYSGLIDIIATDRSPEAAMELASKAAVAYEKYSLEMSTKRTTEARTFIEQQLSVVAGRLDSAQQALKEFRKSSLPYSTADIASLTPLLDLRRTLRDRLTVLEEQKLRLVEGAGILISQGAILEAGAIAPYSDVYAQLTTLMAERNRLLLTYTEEAEPVRSLDNRIQKMKDQLLITIGQDAVILAARLEELDEVLDAYPDKEINLASLQRVVDLNTELLTQLQTSLQEVKIRQAEQVREEVTIINFPTTASADQQGGRGMKTVVGLLMGLMLGIVMAFILETMDTSIGTIEDVEEYLEIPVLAVIPHLDVDKIADRLVEKNRELADDANLDMYARLITQYDPRSPAAESYRTLRTNLQFATAGAGESMEVKNTFVFTSSSLQEGKSTTLVNLAITVAQAGSRVLLLGCNLRRPTIYKSFGLPRERGMTDILTGQLEWRDCIKSVTDMMVGPLSLQDIMSMPGLDNLHILTSGGIPPNPSELLNSPRFKKLIEEASQEYDLVLVDCPPILPVTDAAIVGRQVDWAVLIYQVGKVPRNALRRAKAHLSNVGAHVLGIAMNDVRSEISGYSPYSQYMIKYYGEEEKPRKTHLRKTLIHRLRDLFSRKTEEAEKEGEEERPTRRRIKGKKKKSTWIDVDYYGNGETQPTENDLGTLPYSQLIDHDSDIGPPGTDLEEEAPASPPEPTPETEEQTEVQPEQVWYRKIPLWIWVAIGVLLLLLVLSSILDFLPGKSTETITEGSLPVAQQEVSKSPPLAVEPPASPPSRIRQDTPTPATLQKVWSVQVGSFRTVGQAESLVQRLSPDPGSLWIRAEEVPDLGVWYRVFMGQYPERAECERAAQILSKSRRVAFAMVRSVSPPIP